MNSNAHKQELMALSTASMCVPHTIDEVVTFMQPLDTRLVEDWMQAEYKLLESKKFAQNDSRVFPYWIKRSEIVNQINHMMVCWSESPNDIKEISLKW